MPVPLLVILCFSSCLLRFWGNALPSSTSVLDFFFKLFFLLRKVCPFFTSMYMYPSFIYKLHITHHKKEICVHPTLVWSSKCEVAERKW